MARIVHERAPVVGGEGEVGRQHRDLLERQICSQNRHFEVSLACIVGDRSG
jgi:hypothetical protein